MKLRLGAIPQKFLTAWLAFHDISLTHQDVVFVNSQGYMLQSEYLTRAINDSYKNFRKSKQTYDNFFGRTIVFVQFRNEKFHIKTDIIGHDPLFVWLPDHHYRGEMRNISYRAPLAKLFSVKPVKMDTSIILKLFGIDEPFECIFDLEEKYDLALDFYETDGSDFWRSSRFPGFKSKAKQRIQIAKDSNETVYWLPPMVEAKIKFQCRKFPGKCRYQADDITHLKRHTATCISETKIVTKKVNN